jgi:NADPH2:quinone reductase
LPTDGEIATSGGTADADASSVREIVMKAICVTTDRELEVRELAAPVVPPADHLLVAIEASAINHGDKFFLKSPMATSLARTGSPVWGASAVGRVTTIGDGVSADYLGKRVAIYLSMRRTPETIGLWSETAQVHHLNCLILPEQIEPADYSGSLVNAITAYGFLSQVQEEGHRGVVATAGQSATARALAAVARERGVPVIYLVRSSAARDALRQADLGLVLVTTDPGFEREFEALAERLGATAVFDGLGGEIVSRLAPHMPRGSTFYFYGFLAAGTPFSLETRIFVERNLTMKPFGSSQSPIVMHSARLALALGDLRRLIANPLFRTPVGRVFAFDEIEAAMAYDDENGKAVLRPL